MLLRILLQGPPLSYRVLARLRAEEGPSNFASTSMSHTMLLLICGGSLGVLYSACAVTLPSAFCCSHAFSLFSREAATTDAALLSVCTCARVTTSTLEPTTPGIVARKLLRLVLMTCSPPSEHDPIVCSLNAQLLPSEGFGPPLLPPLLSPLLPPPPSSGGGRR